MCVCREGWRKLPFSLSGIWLTPTYAWLLCFNRNSYDRFLIFTLANAPHPLKCHVIYVFYWQWLNLIWHTVVDIYQDDTTISGNVSNNQDVSRFLTPDLVQWSETWLVNFNASNAKLPSFQYQRSDYHLTRIEMNSSRLEKALFFDKLLILTLSLT